MFVVLKVSKNLVTPSPTSADVLYEWYLAILARSASVIISEGLSVSIMSGSFPSPNPGRESFLPAN